MSGKGWFDQTLEQIEVGISQKKQSSNADPHTPKNFLGAIASQITGKGGSTDHGSNEAGQANAQAQQAAQKANEDMVKELYAPSGKEHSAESGEEKNEEQSESQKAASEFIQKKVEGGMDPEEAQKLYSLRKQLHNEYYQKLINYGKNQPEERTAEKVEKEKEQDEMKNIEEQKRKDAPIAVMMGANKAEQFPGASG